MNTVNKNRISLSKCTFLFLDAIASQELGYESQGVKVIFDINRLFIFFKNTYACLVYIFFMKFHCQDKIFHPEDFTMRC